MRVALLSACEVSTGHGGAQAAQNRRELAAALTRKGHSISLYEIAQTDVAKTAADRNGYELHPWPVDCEGSDFIAELAEFLQDSWERTPPDVAHAHDEICGLAAQFAARALRIPVVQSFGSVTSRTSPFGAALVKTPARSRLEAFLAQHAAWLTPQCCRDADQLARIVGSRRRITVINNGFHIDVPSTRAPVWHRGGPIRIVCVADHLDPQSSLGRAIHTLARQVQAQVDFVKSTSPVDISPLLRSAHILIAAASTEWTDGIVLQATGNAVPVIAVTGGGAEDILVKDVTGLLVTPGRTDELISAMRFLIENPFIREGMGSAGRVRVRACFTWERVAVQTQVVYERAIAHSLNSTPQKATPVTSI